MNFGVMDVTCSGACVHVHKGTCARQTLTHPCALVCRPCIPAFFSAHARPQKHLFKLFELCGKSQGHQRRPERALCREERALFRLAGADQAEAISQLIRTWPEYGLVSRRRASKKSPTRSGHVCNESQAESSTVVSSSRSCSSSCKYSTSCT